VFGLSWAYSQRSAQRPNKTETYHFALGGRWEQRSRFVRRSRCDDRRTTQRNSHICDREIADHYVEPEWCSERLFQVEDFHGAVHDPCCGFGTIPEAARQAGLIATGADLVDRGYTRGRVEEFLGSSRRHGNVVCNPPFDTAREFTLHALKLVQRKVAMVFPTARLNAARWLRETPLQSHLAADAPPVDAARSRDHGRRQTRRRQNRFRVARLRAGLRRTAGNGLAAPRRAEAAQAEPPQERVMTAVAVVPHSQRRPNQHTAGWPPYRVEELKRRWAAGESFGVISAAMKLTRNQIAAAKARLGLPTRKTKTTLPNATEGAVAALRHWNNRPATTKPTPKKVAKSSAAPAPKKPPPGLPKEKPEVTPVETRVGLLELKPGQCKFPIGDPKSADFAFCGQPAVSGRRYCAEHYRRAVGGVWTPTKASTP
jgi:hypothetical protein